MTGEIRVGTCVRIALASLGLVAASAAAAGDFDGSKLLLCAPVEVIDCEPGVPCVANTPGEIGAPAFLRIDVAQKQVIGPKRTSPIVAVQKTEAQLLLQGTEIGYAWAIALEQASGRMALTLTNGDGAFVLFGSCTPL
jgi:hypothetical protein